MTYNVVVFTHLLIIAKIKDSDIEIFKHKHIDSSSETLRTRPAITLRIMSLRIWQLLLNNNMSLNWLSFGGTMNQTIQPLELSVVLLALLVL